MNKLFRIVRMVALYLSAERLIKITLTLLLFMGFLQLANILPVGWWH